MAERKAVNKYYPPDWDPRKGSVNKRVGQHPLRDRARKLSQGILVIRFELPYNIWCGGCGIHVGMGVRYNAEKSKVGNYYSTPIYKFRMKCHLCDNYFEIQTDPKNHDYVILNGARRKEQRWDPVANGQIVPEDKATQKKLATDPMYKLEHGSDDQVKGKQQVSSLAELEEERISMVDDYILNRMARDKFRTEKRQLREAAEADQAILDKSALDLDLVEETEEDRKLAGLLKYSVTTSYEEKQKEKRKSIEQRPLFTEAANLSPFQSSTRSFASSSSSSSSSSSASFNFKSLQEPLPYQKHTKPELSRRGELKQKLGSALRASYKDPFQARVVTVGPAVISKPASSLQKQLGIRLKGKSPVGSPAMAKASLQLDQAQILTSPSWTAEAKPSQETSGNSSVSDTSLNTRHAKIASQALSLESDNVIVKVMFTSEHDHQPHGLGLNSCQSTSTGSDIDSAAKSHVSGTPLRPETSKSDSPLLSHNQKESPGVPQNRLSTADHGSSPGVLQYAESDKAVKEGPKVNSSLSTLMSSYGASDSDSSD